MQIVYYILIFIASLLVDVIPLFGPPAWIVMGFFQIRFDLNIWYVLIAGVAGSAIGRYIYSIYVFYLAKRFIKQRKNEDLQFIGKRIMEGGWKTHFFVFLYTLVPLPSTPLFTAAGVARMNTLLLMPAFFAGKFISDTIMVITGDTIARDLGNIQEGFLSWNNAIGFLTGLLIIFFFLFTDWRKLIEEKKFCLHFKIWK